MERYEDWEYIGSKADPQDENGVYLLFMYRRRENGARIFVRARGHSEAIDKLEEGIWEYDHDVMW